MAASKALGRSHTFSSFMYTRSRCFCLQIETLTNRLAGSLVLNCSLLASLWIVLSLLFQILYPLWPSEGLASWGWNQISTAFLGTSRTSRVNSLSGFFIATQETRKELE